LIFDAKISIFVEVVDKRWAWGRYSESVSSFIGLSVPQAAGSMPEEPARFHAISDSSVTDNFNIKKQSE
jgi:hypothetical protein